MTLSKQSDPPCSVASRTSNSTVVTRFSGRAAWKTRAGASKERQCCKKPIFEPFKAVFRAQNEQQGLQGNMAENGVIWVKNSTSDILIREVISEVRHAEKRVFSPF